jgi:putative thioredoxin
MASSPCVRDIRDADYEREVIEASKQQPVVVDFWAPWCGPCRALGPILEKLANEGAGAWRLAKLNVDENPEIAGRFGVRGIPAVYGFRGGEAVARFEGALPEARVREFLKTLIPSEADLLFEEAKKFLAGGHENAAEERLRAALALDARHDAATLALVATLAGRESGRAEARERLDRVIPSPSNYEEVERLAALLRTAEAGGADLAALQAQVDREADSAAARLAYGRALAAAKRHEEALSELLAAVKCDPGFEDGAARKAMLDLFALLGNQHALTERFRRELARALYR